MNIDDFNFMWRGKFVASLQDNQTHLLLPVDVRQRDSGRALLLIHGFSSSPAVYRLLIPGLLNLYDAVVCPVLPGHADNLDAFAKAKASDWLRAVQVSALNLSDSYQVVDVMGLSLGGLLACQLSESFAMNHLFLLAPALFLHGFTSGRLLLAKILNVLGLKSIPNHAGNFHTSGQAELTYRKLPLPAIIEILRIVLADHFVNPACPVDVFLGRYDEVVNNKAVENFFIPNPKVRCHWLENSAHILPLDGDMALILQHVNDVIHS